MKLRYFVFASSIAFLGALSLQVANAASDADKVFVGKVSQGGMYEVEASKLAGRRAVAQDVKDVAFSEVHDHDLVNRELKKIASASGVDDPARLNATFQQRLDKLKAVSGAAFDAAYISDMDQIHDNDEKLFAQEAMEGTGDFKMFAASTDLIVKRHIGALHGTDSK